MADQSHEAKQQRIERLFDAIDLIREDQRDESQDILRQLIREDNNFEDAWLWMSVAVDSIDESTVCLDNVLRINPDNRDASAALFRLRQSETASEQQRDKLRYMRDLTLVALWVLIFALLFAILFTTSSDAMLTVN